MSGSTREQLIAGAGEAQHKWAALALRQRLRNVRRLRHLLAERWPELTRAFGSRSGRTVADTIAAEILPLADACRFLEREAVMLLRPRRVGRLGRPVWLLGYAAEIRREPLGIVLVIGPSNSHC